MLTAQLDNQGTVAVPYALTINKASAAHLNSGAINVTGGNLTLTQTGTTPSLTNTGTITLSPSRVLSVSGGTLDLTAGLLDGPTGTLSTNGTTVAFTTTATVRPRLTLAASTVPGTFTVPVGDSLTLTGGSPTMTLVNNGLLVLQDAMTLNGSLTTGVGSTISVRSNALVGSSTVTIPNGFTNNGLIELTTADAGYTTTLAVTTGTLTNAATGTITTLAGAGGARVLTAPLLDNFGVINVNMSLTSNGAIDQRNALTIASTRTHTITGLLRLLAGTTTVNGTLIKSGGCTNLGGVITGGGTGATCP